jgi:hypothetical protein
MLPETLFMVKGVAIGFSVGLLFGGWLSWLIWRGTSSTPDSVDRSDQT